MGDTGIEHPLLTPSKTRISASGDAKSDAHDASKPILDPELQKIISVWPELPESISAAIVTIVRASKDR
jgi:hypothetical protein